MAWNELVDQILIRNEIRRRQIRVSDDEIRSALLYYPHPDFQRDPAFRTETGEFDMTRYQQFLAQAGQDPQFLAQIEAYYRDLIPRQKLLRQLTLGVYVRDLELWEMWRDANEAVEASYIALAPQDQIIDSEVTVTPEDVASYFAENRERFALPARAEVRFTYIDKTPTPADTVSALELARTIRQEIVDGASFEDVAARESGDPTSAPNGGRMGTVTRGALIAPLDSAAFSRPVETLSEPIATPFGYHLVEVLSRTGDQAEIRHILALIERTADSEVSLLTRADSLESLSSRMTFDEAAGQLGLTISTGEVTTDFALLPGVGSAIDAQDWIFVDGAGAGEVSPLFENESVFYLVELVGESPEGFQSLDDVAADIESQLRMERKLALLTERARGWATELKSGDITLDDLAERVGMSVEQTGRFVRSDFVEGLGQQSPAAGAAFGVPMGGIAGPAVALGQVVLLHVEGRYEADRAAWEAQKESQRTTVTTQIQEARLARFLDGLREST
jgi:parvulin-like peptidyl-prolyl isomerase